MCLREAEREEEPFADCRIGISSSGMGEFMAVSASESEESEMKPMPGVRGFWDTGGRVVGSFDRRQERARTPVRRIIVPRAIW